MGANALLNLNRSLNILAQRQGSEGSPKHKGFLVGNIHKELLVLGGIQDANFSIGDNLVIRLVLGSEAVGFVTTVKETAKAPLKLYFVSFPEKVESVNLRKAQRLNVFLPAEIQAKNSNGGGADLHLLQGMVLNISGGGVLFHHQERRGTLPRGQPLVFPAGRETRSLSPGQGFGQHRAKSHHRSAGEIRRHCGKRRPPRRYQPLDRAKLQFRHDITSGAFLTAGGCTPSLFRLALPLFNRSGSWHIRCGARNFPLNLAEASP